MADKASDDALMEQGESNESQNQYNALLKSHVLGIEDPYLLANYDMDEDENSPQIKSSSHLHIMRSNEKH